MSPSRVISGWSADHKLVPSVSSVVLSPCLPARTSLCLSKRLAIMKEEAMHAAVVAQANLLHTVMGEKSWLLLRTPGRLPESERVLDGLEGPELHDYAEDMHVHLYFKGAAS